MLTSHGPFRNLLASVTEHPHAGSLPAVNLPRRSETETFF
jgi:hypothetical protein